MDVTDADGDRLNRLYQPLDASRSEIRLLKIIPAADPDSPVRCTMHTVSLSDGPVYHALSYVWGDPGQTENVLIDGIALAVTRNLASALRHLRDLQMEETKALWADAICVNQRDMKERSTQVRLMGELYGKASRTIGWLGPADDESGDAIRIIKEVIGKMPGPARQDFFPDLSKYGFEWLRDVRELWEKNTQEFPFNRAWHYLRRFFKRDYWKRVWILQEVVLAGSLVFVCGRDVLSWTYLAKFSELLKFIQEHSETVLSLANVPETDVYYGIQTIIRYTDPHTRVWIFRRLHTLLAFKYTTLYDFVKLTIKLSATDPRDKIYALLGLCQPDIVADYAISNTTCKVYTTFALKMINQENNLDVFRYCQLRKDVFSDSEQSNAQLPSWVPNWQTLAKSTDVLAIMDWFHPAPSEFAVHRANDFQNVLWIKGILVDRISGDMVRIWEPHSIKAALVFAATFLAERKEYVSRISRLQALFRVFMYDEFFKPKLSWDCTAFFDWIAGFFHFFVDVICEAQNINNQNAVELACAHMGVPGDAAFRISLLEALFETGVNSASPGSWTSATEAYYVGRMTEPSFIQKSSHIVNSTIFRSDGGYLGLSNGELEPGDIVCIVFGSRLPVVLRRVASGFSVVGTCFIPGLMEGEALNELRPDGPLTVQEIELH